MTITTNNTVDSLLAILANSRKTVEQINAACTAKGLPPAFVLGEDSAIALQGNPDYRFEGFGTDVVRVFPPKLALSFWVHYKPESPQHVEVGRFTVPISI